MSEEKIISEWNMADATMKVIDEIRNKCREARHYSDFNEWYKHLYDFYFEVDFLMSPDERKEIVEKLAECNNKIKDCNDDDINTQKTSELFAETEIKIRRFIKELWVPKKRDPNLAVTRR